MINLVLIFVTSFALFAEEAEKPAEAPVESSRAAIELMALEKQVAATAAKVAGKEASVMSLIKQKKAETDPAKVAETIKLLQQEHNDLKQLIKEHDQQLTVLKYRFPERGSTYDRKYKRFSSKSLEQMEQAVGVEKHLYDARKKVKKVYGVDTKNTGKQPESETKTQQNSILNPTVISK
jgi:hypothetical protein